MGAVLIVTGAAVVMMAKGRNMKKRMIAIGALLAMGAALVGPADAQELPVTLSNGGGTQTVIVEDVLGTATLTELDFDQSRSLPFRVRVVDTGTNRSPFTVDASMTNLYRSTGVDQWDFATPIPSVKVSISSAASGLSARNVLASVGGTVDGVLTVADATMCSALTLLGSACTLNLNNMAMVPQEVPVDLSVLDNLPLVPQAVDPGTFDDPDWAGVALGDDDAPAPGFTYTTHRVIGGGLPVGAAETAMLAALQASLEGVVDGAAATTDVVTAGELANAIRAAVPAIGDALLEDLLTQTMAFTADTIGLDDILGVAGTYLSYPVLAIDTTGAAQGSYEGTLVVTGIQP